MWRDVNIFNEVGIPAATFGMPRKSAPDVPHGLLKFVTSSTRQRWMRWWR
jgi:hypothetical protein